ncbi:MAG TPA: hypothetical protein VKR23_15195 [Gaiellaceae bacterium]|nr:hypothetical protein [Gaiellaceae bacterium]
MAARRFVVLAVCAPVLVLAACGSSSAATLTKAQYDSRVNRLCLVSADQIRELHIDNTVADWRSRLGASVVKIDKRFTSKLAGWSPPASIASPAAAYAKANAKVTQDDRNSVAAAKANDGARLRAALNQANKDALATSLSAKAIGATGCYIP